MSYVGIGNRQDYIADFPTQSFNGDGSTTTFTLNFEAVTGSVRVAVDNVLQPADGTSYYTNGNSITFTSAPATGTANITVTYLGTVRNVSSVSDGAITTAKLADGAVTNVKLANSSITLNGSAVSLGGSASVSGVFETQLLHIRDEKSSGTSSGSSSSGSWQTRTLNTIKTNEITSASLSSNQITLPSGTYYIMAKANHFDGDRHKIKLRNITDSSDEIIGSSEYAEDTYNGTTNSYLNGRFTIGGTKTFELQHRCEVAGSFGVPSSFGVIEVFADVQIWKVA